MAGRYFRRTCCNHDCQIPKRPQLAKPDTYRCATCRDPNADVADHRQQQSNSSNDVGTKKCPKDETQKPYQNTQHRYLVERLKDPDGWKRAGSKSRIGAEKQIAVSPRVWSEQR